MRYFFISYAHSAGFGSMSLQLEEFPNEAAVIKTLEDESDIPEPYKQKLTSITILSLFEFRTKEDFDAFNNTGE
jgi:hypothetical protein